MRSPKKHWQQHGISLLEVMLSLSIIAVILVMATRYFFVASHNNKVNTTISQIGGIIAAVHSFKGADATFDNTISIDTLAAAGQLTNFPGYDIKNKTLSSMWGDTFTLTANGGFVHLEILLPNAATCMMIKKAYPPDINENTGSLQSNCSGAKFIYVFP